MKNPHTYEKKKRRRKKEKWNKKANLLFTHHFLPSAPSTDYQGKMLVAEKRKIKTKEQRARKRKWLILETMEVYGAELSPDWLRRCDCLLYAPVVCVCVCVPLEISLVCDLVVFTLSHLLDTFFDCPLRAIWPPFECCMVAFWVLIDFWGPFCCFI